MTSPVQTLFRLVPLVMLGAVLAPTVPALEGGDAAGPRSVYWRFEKGADGEPARSSYDDRGKIEATSGGGTVAFSAEVPMAIIPLTAAANHLSLWCKGGCLRAKSCPELNLTGNFTVELWAKFSAPRSGGSVLLAKGSPTAGNWHLIYQTDGTVQANIFGQQAAYLFDPDSGGPAPGTWYHLAAVFEEQKGGKTRIRTYVNGQERGGALVAALKDTSATDLFIGSFIDGSLSFQGMIDELRITPAVLGPKSFLLAGTQPVIDMSQARKPVFVPAATRIGDAERRKAAGAPILLEPDGYRYFYAVATGGVTHCGEVPQGRDGAFGTALQGWGIAEGGSSAAYHFAVKPSGKYLVAMGFYDPASAPGRRRQHVVIDGRLVDTLDPAADGKRQPFVRKYPARDENGDGFLQIAVSHALDEPKVTGMLNAIWTFNEGQSAEVDAGKLMRGVSEIPPLYFVDCGREERMPGHVGFPPLGIEARQKMLPMRRIPFDLQPDWPQPADPLDVEIRGELADRIRSYLDRWGFAGRDQRLVAGFLSDSGFEVSGRNIETIYMLSRLTKCDFDLKVPFESLLGRQDAKSKHPGSFVGGTPLRTGFIWSQGTIFSGLMAYHELSGDPRALEAAGKLADWYEAYLKNQDLAAANYFLEPKNEFSRNGATVGQLGEGALEPMLWLYWRTKDPRHLERAKRIAELKRRYGGVAWMIHGDIADLRPEYESWHLHANLSTVRGFPWLYAATGDRSYLEDAVRACDRVYERATWGIGCVLEQIPWLRDPDPHDETCQTADELMLSYLLGEFAGEGRFYDRGETIYYNAIRYMQMHRGNFTAFNRLPGPTRGGDAWFCCGWWGAKALYETARHLYAASPTEVYVTGFMPSGADLRLKNGVVHIETQADIPRSGRVCLTVTPKNIATFALNLRVPGWAVLQEVRVNGNAAEAVRKQGYVRLERSWKAGDRVDVEFDLPLRVVLDSAWDTLSTAKASVDGAAPVDTRCVSIYRGPVILAQFRLLNGVDLNWAYTGDHPDLFETLGSVADRFAVGEQKFESNSGPALTRMTRTPEGVKLEWGWKPGPGWGWSVRRSALVRPTVPVQIDYAAEITLPNLTGQQMEEVCKTARLCGVRMRTSGFVDYTKARLRAGDNLMEYADLADKPVPGRSAALDNGYVQFRVSSEANDLVAVDEPGLGYSGIYCRPRRQGDRQIAASCKLTITGQSRFAMPVIAAMRLTPR